MTTPPLFSDQRGRQRPQSAILASGASNQTFASSSNLAASVDEVGAFHAPRIARAAVLDERTSRHAFRLRVSEEDSGLPSAILASGASNQTLREQLKSSCERRESRARRAEEERAEVLFPPRATTKSAHSTRPGSRRCRRQLNTDHGAATEN